MKFNPEKLYELLPVIFRIRDTEIGRQLLQGQLGGEVTAELAFGPLRALLEVIGREVEVMEENLDQLYDDLFIETCAEWAVDYIGKLIGHRSLINIPGFMSQRASVANTIALRRSKGTLQGLEQLAASVTNYYANVVEYFPLVAVTQHVNHLRPTNVVMPRISGNTIVGRRHDHWQALHQIRTPFDRIPRTADVRSIERNLGKHLIQNIGIYLWRIKDYGITKAPAFKQDDKRYKFSILGKDIQLYNSPEPERSTDQLAQRRNVPMPISRRELYERLPDHYGNDKSFVVELNGVAIPIASICVCNLSDKDDNSGDWNNMPEDKVAIDPELGRIALYDDIHIPLEEADIKVNYTYGFSADTGSGTYNRENSFDDLAANQQQIEVGQGNRSIQDAIDALPATGGLILIKDNELYQEDLEINLQAGSHVEIRARDGNRPTIQGDIEVTADENAKLTLNGLLIFDGNLIYSSETSKTNNLKIVHCTLVPNCLSPVKLIVDSDNTAVEIIDSITGELKIHEDSDIRIHNSIIDARADANTAIAGISVDEPSGKLHITGSTVIGKVHTRLMEMASNTIFWAKPPAEGEQPSVRSSRLQEGCVRFCYFPERSSLRRPFRCQPQSSGDPRRVKPLFTSLSYGEAGYCQLSAFCAKEIAEGADDEAEMGAFHDQYQPQKISNLRTRLDEYMRFGMEAGIFLAS